jgi:hypothetical protein
MMMKGPEENPADRHMRMRERRITGLEQAAVGQESAKSLTTDLMSVYDIENGKNNFRGPKPGAKPLSETLADRFPNMVSEPIKFSR